MKGAIFNFLVLQVVVWTFVFSTRNNDSSEEIVYASISDTWTVNKLDSGKEQGIVLHYPSFQKLTLNQDGTYLRSTANSTVEEGSWNVNQDVTKLTLVSSSGVKQYEIVQFPDKESESFIIKERNKESSPTNMISYELIRI